MHHTLGVLDNENVSGEILLLVNDARCGVGDLIAALSRVNSVELEVGMTEDYVEDASSVAHQIVLGGRQSVVGTVVAEHGYRRGCRSEHYGGSRLVVGHGGCVVDSVRDRTNSAIKKLYLASI